MTSLIKIYRPGALLTKMQAKFMLKLPIHVFLDKS